MVNEEKFYREAAFCFLKYNLEIENPSEQQIKEMRLILFGNYLSAAKKSIPKLSFQEQRCLYYASQGHSYKTIANLLNVSPHTVRGYQKTLLSKLRCSTMRQAIMLAYRLEIIPAPIAPVFT